MVAKPEKRWVDITLPELKAYLGISIIMGINYNLLSIYKISTIGHVQKRMGTHLRDIRKKQTKLSDGKSVKGSKHRLTDKAIDKLQTYYGNAIRANVKPGKLTAQQQKEQISVMQTAIKAVLYHSCELLMIKKGTSIAQREMIVGTLTESREPSKERITI